MRKAEVFLRAGGLAALAAGLALGISGCGSADKPAPHSAPATVKPHKPKGMVPAKPGEEDLGDMVAAVQVLEVIGVR